MANQRRYPRTAAQMWLESRLFEKAAFHENKKGYLEQRGTFSQQMKTLLMSNRICANCGWALHFKEKIGMPSFQSVNVLLYFVWLKFFYFIIIVRIGMEYTVPKIQVMYSQKWTCAASFPIPTVMYLGAIYIFPGLVSLFGCSKIGRPILGIYKSLTDTVHEWGNWETEHYNSVLEIMRPHRVFISGNTSIGTRYLYWIPTGPSFAV
jgi:hypothetical protein